MYKNTRKETQNHAITRINLYSWVLKAFDKFIKNNYNSSVFLNDIVLRLQKAKNLKKTNASFRGLERFFGNGVVIALF
ncbi:hypothetical protein NP0156_08910 [Helicobacter pylori]